MKVISLLILASLLSACSQAEVSSLPSERILEFRQSDDVIGYGVVEGDVVITATHVIELCRKLECNLPDRGNLTGTIISINDLSIIHAGSSGGIPLLKLPQKGDGVYVLRNQEGKYHRYDAKITALHTDYIAFDSKLVPKFYTGGIEIDMALKEGESGLPVWSSSGELIGVVSATDMVNGKSYIVQ